MWCRRGHDDDVDVGGDDGGDGNDDDDDGDGDDGDASNSCALGQVDNHCYC